MQRISLLGATGSVGRSTLEVIALNPERYQVYALTGHSRMDQLALLCSQFHPQKVVVADGQQREYLRQCGAVDAATQILVGREGLIEVAVDPCVDTVMAAIVGAAGLEPTLAAVCAGKRVLLANKEALVMSGDLFMQSVRQSAARLLPVDSEHSAIFQCLAQPGRSLHEQGVEKLVLTGSGGPFRTLSKAALAQVTPAMAVRHPRWSMGPKISVDSATLMNKGLELIEACWLFDAAPEAIEIWIHPQSIVHSLVRYQDGSTLAQLGYPDMRTPIAVALAWPERIVAGVAPLDLLTTATLEFEAPDRERFPCLDLARQAMAAGGSAPTLLNAANEVAVQAFLQNETPFSAIPAIIAATLDRLPVSATATLEQVIEADRQARQVAGRLIHQHRAGI